MGKDIHIPEAEAKKLIENFNEFYKMQRDIFSKLKIPTSFEDGQGKNIDQRDFYDIALCFEPHGNTPDEISKDMEKQIVSMVDAFKSKDPTAKNKYLDRMFDLLDNTPSYFDHNIVDPQEFREMIASASLNQAYAVKRNENIEYFKNRYGTIEKIIEKGASSGLNSILGTKIQDFADSHKPKLITKGFVSSKMISFMDVDYSRNLAFSKAESFENEKDYIDYEVPLKCFDDVEKGLKMERFSYSFDEYFMDVDFSVLFGRYSGTNNQNSQITDYYKFVYINNKSLNDIALDDIRAEYGNIEFKDNLRFKAAEVAFRKALINNEGIINLVTPISFEDGKVDFVITPLKPNIKKLKKDLAREGRTDEIASLPDENDVDDMYFLNAHQYDNVIKDEVHTFLENERDKTLVDIKTTNDSIKVDDNIVQESFKKYDEMYSLVLNSASKIEGFYDFDPQLDKRDFTKMALLLNVNGNTLEEKQLDMDNQLSKMYNAFINNNQKEKKEYLDMMYDAFDKSILALKIEMKEQEYFYKTIVATQLTQTVETKAKENPEFFKMRYNKHSQLDTFRNVELMHQNALGLSMLKIYEKQLGDHKPLPIIALDDPKLYGLTWDVALQKSNTKTNGTIELKIDPKLKVSQVETLISALTSQNKGSEALNNEYGMKSATLSSSIQTKAFYLNNDSLDSLAIANLRKTKEYSDPNTKIHSQDITKEGARILRDALKKGDKVISYVEPREYSDKTVHNVYKIKPDTTACREAEYMKHSWFRRTFFDWGPFKIELPPKQTDIDDMYNRTKNALQVLKSFNADMQSVKAEYEDSIRPTKKLEQASMNSVKEIAKEAEMDPAINEKEHIDMKRFVEQNQLTKSLMEATDSSSITNVAKSVTEKDPNIKNEKITEMNK